MSNEIENMIKIGSHRVLFNSKEGFLLSMKYNLRFLQNMNDEEVAKKQAITVFIVVGS